MKGKYYAVSSEGGCAAGTRQMIAALLLVGWKETTYEEYLVAKHEARRLDALEAIKHER